MIPKTPQGAPRSIRDSLAHQRQIQRDQLFYAFVAPYIDRLPQTRMQKLTLQYPPDFTKDQIRHQWRKVLESNFSTAGRFRLSFTAHHNGWVLTITRKDFPQPTCPTILDTTEVTPVATEIPEEPYVAPWIKETLKEEQRHQSSTSGGWDILNRKGYKPEDGLTPPSCPNSDKEEDADEPLNTDEQSLFDALDKEPTDD